MLKASNEEGDSSLPESLARAALTPALREKISEAAKSSFSGYPPNPPLKIIIDLNLNYFGGWREARNWVMSTVRDLIKYSDVDEYLDEETNEHNQQYVFARLLKETIENLIKIDRSGDKPYPEKKEPLRLEDAWAIHNIWPDFEVSAFINKSISTVKVDAARTSFSATGEGITWAVIDSGIDKAHIHFAESIHPDQSFHRDFTVSGSQVEDPFSDVTGHGTHVAGIISGEQRTDPGNQEEKLFLYKEYLNEQSRISYRTEEVKSISGMASKCQLVSLKVLNNENGGDTSSVIKALNHIQEINRYGRDLKIHGINLSLGYRFLAEWYACGQSPLCVEVDRMVKSGVVVVVAAGNAGFGDVSTMYNEVRQSGLPMSITDPGNADLAITVGSTHRDQPHTYGVSFFSSKGPTGDGRLKPDLLAPGERIISCAAGRNITKLKQPAGPTQNVYIEQSGTSMAAPHVSGVIAAFLSIRREYIGKPEVVKELFLRTATDLRREKQFQGYGLIDLMRAIQAV